MLDQVIATVQQLIVKTGVLPAADVSPNLALAVVVALVALPLLLLATVGGGAKAKKAPVSLDPTKKVAFPLIKREIVSHDTRLFRFGLPSPAHHLGLPVGKHIFVSADIADGEGKVKLVSRPYTPTSSDNVLGYFDLVVKVYAPAAPKFPHGGLMSQHLDSLAIGDTVNVRGPLGAITLVDAGAFSVRARGADRRVPFKHVGMIAGGTGITPMYQVVEALAAYADAGALQRGTTVSLLFANQSADDILLRAELDGMKERYPALEFNVHYTVDTAPRKWTGSVGFVDEAMVEQHLPAAGDDTVVLLCGPPPMIKFACLPALTALGHDSSRVLTF
jgi:NAD(P)H-flavin reductase